MTHVAWAARASTLLATLGWGARGEAWPEAYPPAFDGEVACITSAELWPPAQGGCPCGR